VSERLPIVLVAAVARNGVIGGDNKLLWRLSSDLKRFKALTWGKPMIMGRKTYESIGRPLPGRETIVVTRGQSFRPEGIHIAHSLDAALDLAVHCACDLGASEIIIAGGGEIYRQAMARADRMEITHVELEPDGDSHFPEIDPNVWSVVSREAHEAGPGDEAAFSFCVYERSGNGRAGVEKTGEGA
jgi:dihydrofolate reductase